MEKAKKILSIAIKVFLLVCVITYFAFYIALPTETKEFTNLVFDKLNTPIGITGISLLGFGYIAYKIISLLPFSKTAKEKLLESIEEEKNKNKAYREEIAKKVNELNNTKNECIAIVGAYKDKYDNLEQQLLKVCETSPNAKIKALGEEYKCKKELVEQEIKEKYYLEKNTIVSKVDETTKNYNSILEDIKKLKESVYGKEETND